MAGGKSILTACFGLRRLQRKASRDAIEEHERGDAFRRGYHDSQFESRGDLGLAQWQRVMLWSPAEVGPLTLLPASFTQNRFSHDHEVFTKTHQQLVSRL